MKVIIIGTNHAGIAAAKPLLEHYPEVELTMIDRNSNMSFLGCGTAIWLGRQVETTEGMFYAEPGDFEAKGATVMLETNVSKVDYKNRQVYFEAAAGVSGSMDYDKLLIATGSKAIVPKIPGMELEGIHYLKLYQEGQALEAAFAAPENKRVAVIGAGYIGTEIAEAARRRGKEVLLFDAAAHSLASYYDSDFAAEMDTNLAENGIDCHFNEVATAFLGKNGKITGIQTDKGDYPVDMVVNAIGFTANNPLGGEHLATFGSGAILTDHYQQTSDPDVYAAGDCTTIYSGATRQEEYIALASNAVRSGIVAAHNLAGNPLQSAGAQGSNGISIFGLNLVSTGLSLAAAEKIGMEVDYSDHEDWQKANFFKADNDRVKIRIVYEKSSRRIVGAQMVSKSPIIAGNVNMFSLAIQEGVTIDKLALTDLFFLPHFNQPYNYMTVAALNAK